MNEFREAHLELIHQAKCKPICQGRVLLESDMRDTILAQGSADFGQFPDYSEGRILLTAQVCWPVEPKCLLGANFIDESADNY